MSDYFHSGVVVKYSATGYTGVDIKEVITASDTEAAFTFTPRKLTQVLGDDVPACTAGVRGMYFPEDTVEDYLSGVRVIDATISEVGRMPR